MDFLAIVISKNFETLTNRESQPTQSKPLPSLAGVLLKRGGY
jgi:hypothetical protein